MKHIKIEEHVCSDTKDIHFFGGGGINARTMCNMSPKHILFYMNSEFYLCTYFTCVQGYEHHLDFKEMIFNKVKEVKLEKKNEVWRSQRINENFQQQRKLNVILESKIKQVIYTYDASFGNYYAFTYDIDFFDVDSDKIKKSYEEMKVYLADIGLDYKHSELQELYHLNITDHLRKAESVQSLNHLTKLIRNEISRTSNH